MDIFNFLKKKSNGSIYYHFAKKWSNRYFIKTHNKKTNAAYAENLIFNFWAAWIYYKETNTISYYSENGDKELIYGLRLLYGKIISICPMPYEYFSELFRIRQNLYHSEIYGLLKSDYPRTKQFIPFSLYCALEKNPLKFVPTKNINKDIDDDDDFDEWMYKIMKHWNHMITDIEKKFPSNNIYNIY